jgi:hypothetical protein
MKGARKYYWYMYMQIRYWMWRLFKKPEDHIFMENCTIANLKVSYWETHIFWFALYNYEYLKKYGSK